MKPSKPPLVSVLTLALTAALLVSTIIFPATITDDVLSGLLKVLELVARIPN